MNFKQVFVVFVTVSVLMLVKTASSRPRDLQAQNNDEIRANEFEMPEHKELQNLTSKNREQQPEILSVHNRIPCEFEEVTEDPVCQRHCLPKGYSYGICVGLTCSCI